mmetsp:Transcript_17920/g.34992  ORF Transcript_17920/g.34992 Transcript_17920/m.34992 type:complete len:336 (+) Transcript_17920:87-1094(+)|eukprot:CAMPEP_0172811840 /NCGR_PEP_ID=MMETSP1075-20121228/9663_1 /TAXON_ID=2916 /ORGANISM="Ceratium fusus, Strain PA161109" /LENGTH=335 /DNA_ID=CAMNT_0013651315 /DNA_START=53 /DNA_END=1060 /DNA_ORIENTATION=-
MELHRFQEANGVITSDAQAGLGPDRCWCLSNTAAEPFGVEVELVEGSLATLSVGFADASKSLQELKTDTVTGVHRIVVADRIVYFPRGESNTYKELWKHMVEGVELRKVHWECMKIDGSLKVFCGINEEGCINLTPYFGNLPEGPVKPLFSIASPLVSVRCRIVYSAQGSRLHSGLYLSRQGHALWGKRAFTDMSVHTLDDERIPCHRAILAEGSPVLVVELERWADGTPEINVAANRPEVEAMLRFFYTGELDESAPLHTLLPLSHRYQVCDLTTIVIDRMLSCVSSKTVIPYVRALGPLRDADGQLHMAWRKLCMHIADRMDLVESAMLQLCD